MKNKSLVITMVSLSVLLAGCAAKEQTQEYEMEQTETTLEEEKTQIYEYKSISAEEAKEIMDNETQYLILDVRTKEEFDEGHIPEAVLLPNEEIDEDVSEILPDQEQKILVYCRSGNRSKQASDKLSKLGYSNIIEFGGIVDWPYEIEVTK